jgi:hypothetical protein
MTLILSGTNGVSDIDGSAATPAIRGTDANTGIFFPAADTIAFSEGGVESMRLDSSANLQFNSGYGSVATAYGCRAWVNFNGTGTVAIRASGNVSSITDAGTGQYTVNFTTAMPDTNYATIGSGYTASSGLPAFTNATRAIAAFSNTSSSCRIQVYRSDTNSFDADSPEMNVAIFR